MASVGSGRLFLLLMLLLTRTNGLLVTRGGRKRLSLGATSHLPSPHDIEQFELFRPGQVGTWKGIQTGYDPKEDTVEDHMYTEGMGYDEGDELVHVAGFVAGEIRADCEVCYDSERLKQREVGRYKVGKLPNIRAVRNAVLRGPAPTRRGLSTELQLFSPDPTPEGADLRVRVLLAYQPIAFADVAGVGKVPSVMELGDVIIVRERRGRRPLKLDDKPDDMWRGADENISPTLTHRHRFDPVGLVGQSPTGQSLPHTNLPESTAAKVAAVEAGRGSSIYDRTFPGGLRVEADLAVYAGSEARARVTWRPSQLEPQRVYRAELSFSALDEVQVGDGESIRVSPPKIKEFFVEFT